MGFVARSRRKMWFGTEEYATWIPTPNSGADSSPQAWNETGTFLGGDGYAIGSRNSHKQYVYEWPSSSSREDAQLMKSFYEGTYGRGKLYFVEPLIYDTNVLPAKWANPAITCGFEGPSLVPGVDPVELTRADVVGGFFDLVGVQEPLVGALYNLTDVPGSSATFTPVYENHFTNPRLKGDGTWAPVYENLFTNPRLKGDGTWAEVRRNYIPNPRAAVNTTGWSVVRATLSRGASTLPQGGFRFAVTSTETGTLPAVAFQTVSVGPGSYVLSFKRDMGGSSPIFADAQVSGVTLASVSSTSEIVNLAFTVSEPSSVLIRIGVRSGEPVGTSVAFTDVFLGVPGPYFDGSSPDFSVDPDMRSRWLGAPNASESVMEIERVAGSSWGWWNGVFGVSLPEKTRFIQAYQGTATRTLLNGVGTADAPPGADYTVTFVAENRTGIDITRLRVGLRRMGDDVYSYNELSLPAGAQQQFSVPVTASSGGGSGLHFLLFGVEQQIPRGGELIIEDIGLFAGNYPYETFNGESDPAETGIEQPEDFRIRWTGAVDNSTSVMEGEVVAGVTGLNAEPIVSSRGGKPAIRLLPRFADIQDSAAQITIPAVARSGGTVLGTVHLTEPLNDTWTSNQTRPLSVRAYTPMQGVQAPNVSGEESLRLSYEALAADFIARWYHGGRKGSGDVWWTDIGLFAGVYDGPAFSGSDGSVTIDGIPYSTRWVGASDFSVSQAGIWTLDDNIILDDRNSVFIPIPEGMQLNIGANSREIGSDSPGIYLKPISDTPSNDIYKVGQASRSNLFPLVIPAKNGIRGVRMWIGKLGDSGNPSFVAVNFIHARLSPIGKPPTGPSHWIGGQGHAGTRFALPPTYISNTGVGGGQISYAATFKESLI